MEGECFFRIKEVDYLFDSKLQIWNNGTKGSGGNFKSNKES